MRLELLLLTVLYVVAMAAFVGAINARGPARVALSYFLAIPCLCAAVFHTSQFLAVGPGLLASEPAVLNPPAAPAAPEQGIVLAPPPVDTQDLSASLAATAVAESKAELKAVRDHAQRVLQNLNSLNLGSVSEVSDEEYEALQNRAVNYLSEARKTKERLSAASAKVPAELSEIQETMSRGLESLVVAAYNAERFFKSENDTEERERLANFKRGSQTATAALNRAEGMLAVGDVD